MKIINILQQYSYYCSVMKKLLKINVEEVGEMKTNKLKSYHWLECFKCFIKNYK